MAEPLHLILRPEALHLATTVAVTAHRGMQRLGLRWNGLEVPLPADLTTPGGGLTLHGGFPRLHPDGDRDHPHDPEWFHQVFYDGGLQHVPARWVAPPPALRPDPAGAGGLRLSPTGVRIELTLPAGDHDERDTPVRSAELGWGELERLAGRH